jgi:hypothetical protein
VSLRANYAWHSGAYTATLSRADGDAGGDWFSYSLTDLSTNVETLIGAIRFPRTAASTPATISPQGIEFHEIYAFATDYAQVPALMTDIMILSDGVRATAARSEYPAYPYAVYPNSDAWYDPMSDRVHVAYGGQTPRCHPAGALF